MKHPIQPTEDAAKAPAVDESEPPPDGDVWHSSQPHGGYGWMHGVGDALRGGWCATRAEAVAACWAHSRRDER